MLAFHRPIIQYYTHHYVLKISSGTEVMTDMASYKQTRNGNYYAVNEINGQIVQGQPQGGFSSASGARRWAARNLSGVSSASEVDRF